MNLPDCPDGREDCLFEHSGISFGGPPARRLHGRDGKVTVVPSQQKYSTSTACDKCGKSFIGEGSALEGLTWRLTDGPISRLVIMHTDEPLAP